MNQDDLSIAVVEWQSSHAKLALIRRRVFVEEQQVPSEEEWDDADIGAVHFLATLSNNEQPIACARLLPSGKIGRMAVLSQFRHQGVGSRVLQTVLTFASQTGYPKLFLDAQLHALDFYRRQGFAAEGPEFEDAGILHRRMHWVASKTTAEDPAEHFSGPSEMLAALQEQLSRGRVSLDILSDQLTPALYADPTLAAQVSALARRSPRSGVRILVKDTRPLHGRSHPLVQLAQRLPSRVALRKLTQPPEDANLSFAIIDQRSLLRFTDESEYIGVAKPHGRAEARQLLEEYNRLWEHYGVPDPYLKSLTI